MSVEGFQAIGFIATFVPLAITTLAFYRISMKAIERRMIADGAAVPWAWDKTGLRTAFCALFIALPIFAEAKGEVDPLAAIRDVLPYADLRDRILARAMVASEGLVFVYILVAVYLDYTAAR